MERGPAIRRDFREQTRAGALDTSCQATARCLVAQLLLVAGALVACSDEGAPAPVGGEAGGPGVGTAAALAPATAAIERAASPDHIVELQPAERQSGAILAISPNHIMLLQDTEE